MDVMWLDVLTDNDDDNTYTVFDENTLQKRNFSPYNITCLWDDGKIWLDGSASASASAPIQYPIRERSEPYHLEPWSSYHKWSKDTVCCQVPSLAHKTLPLADGGEEATHLTSILS